MADYQRRFPVDPVTGYVLMVAARSAVAPFTYVDALKIDAQGRVVYKG